MTPKIASAATALVVERINGISGVNANLLSLTGEDCMLPELHRSQIRTGNIAAELAERSNTVRYPSANVYCEKLVNNQKEKFRTFSGFVQMAIDLRHSEDRLDHLQANLEIYTDSVMAVLDHSAGDWGGGIFYGGGYQATFGPVKQGGRNFIQAVKISFEIGVSIS